MTTINVDERIGIPVVLPRSRPWDSTTLTFAVPANLGAGSGTVSAVTAESLDTLKVKLRFTKDATPGSGGSGVVFTMPAGYTIDLNKLTSIKYIGVGSLAGATFGPVADVLAASSTTFVVRKPSTGGNVLGSDLAANYELDLYLEIPIVEFGGGYLAYGQGRVTSVKDGLLPATATLGLIHVGTQNGNGSTNTTVRRWSSVIETKGTDITYADSATAGGTFTINVSGIYAMSLCDLSAAGGSHGITLNNNSPGTTNVAGVNAANVLIFMTSTSGEVAAAGSITRYLNAGDVIRAQTDGAGNTSSVARAHFSIQRLS